MQNINNAAPQLLYMDAKFIVVSKPHNLACSPSTEHTDCLLSRMQELFEDAQIVHEVAFECSGATVLALDNTARLTLAEQAEDGRFSVHYQALTEPGHQIACLQQPAAQPAPKQLTSQIIARAKSEEGQPDGRLLLHINRVELQHPVTRLKMAFDAPCGF
ncbi:MAG: hypothetical protein OIF57_00550 [Marinobacterium sp.]|nr:hypothetical protein [Marinobacterium sp.]